MDFREGMRNRFGNDSVIALATDAGGVPAVRYVDAFYENGCFYVLTHGLSDKMRQIAANNTVAIAGEWFTGSGVAESMGWFCKPQNREIAEKMRRIFAGWIDNGHNDFSDENTIILRIRLTKGVLFCNGTKYVWKE